MSVFDSISIIKQRVGDLKKQIGTLYFAYKDRDTPFLAKGVAIIVVAYALSPIDLIPDFIPIVGYMDDMILLPLGIALAIRLIPKDIIEASRVKAERHFTDAQKRNWVAGSVIILIWVLLLIWIAAKVLERLA